MCQRRSLLVASTSLLLVALFNHIMALTVSIERQAPSAPNHVRDNLSSAPTSRPCSSCAPKTATSPSSSTVSSSSTRSNHDDSTTPHSDAMVQHYERQLLNHLGLSRRPPARKPGTVDEVSDHMHSLYRRFSEEDEWEDFVWIAGDRRKELGRLTSVRAHRLSDLPKLSNSSLRFDLSSLVSVEEERPIAGELRLFLNLTGPPGMHEISVYDMMARAVGSSPIVHRLHTRRIKVPSAAWRSFDVSPALVRWSRRPRWRQTGEGQILLQMKQPRRLRRSVDPSGSPNKADWRQRHAELYSYYQNSNKREKRRHRKRKKNRNKNRKRNRKRNRERRRRRKLRQRYNNMRMDGGSENYDSYSTRQWSDDSIGAGRHEKRNAMVAPDHKNSCQRRKMFVNFAELGWNEWIVAPQGYHAGLCYGSCETQVLSKNFNTTNHAIIQSFVYSASAVVPPPCCVAVELSPKPMLLMDENQNVVLKNYEQMIVDTCGCR